MGRHSVPDPDDPSGERPYPGDEYDDDYSDEYPTTQFTRPEPGPEPPPGYDRYGQPGYGARGYRDTDHRDVGHQDPRYQPGYDDDGREVAGYEDAGYREPGRQDAGYQEGYEDAGYEAAGYEDQEDQDYPESDYWSHDDDLGYEEPEQATRSFATSTPPPRPPSTGPQHGGEWEGGDWTGSHRAVAAGRRGVSRGVIGALAAVVVVVGAFILWRFFGDALSSRSEAAAARCVSGDVAVAVIADPSIADQVRTFADQYNKSATPVGDKCVKVGVKSAGSDQVIDGFTGKWPAELGEQPALWIPGSSVSAARVEAATNKKTITASRSLVTSPVMLAMRPELKTALAQQGWANLPALQTNPTALDGLHLPGWGPLRLALPLIDDSDATYLAAEAVATAAAPPGAPATAGAGAISTLMSGQPKLADAKQSTALDALLQDGAPAAAPVHAVVATEQQIFQRAASLPDAKSKLAAWLPSGPAAIADYPTVLLSGDWLEQEQVTAASEFERFLHKPEALAELSKAGFRVDGATMPTSDVTEFSALSAPPLSLGDKDVRATLANAVRAPAQNPAVTILLDQSMNTEDGGKSRELNVTAALNARLQALPPNAVVGLWTFDGVAGRSEVATGQLGDLVNGQARSGVLTANLNSQVASNGGAVSFTTLRALYTDAVANFREGQENSVLVITAGPHTDQSLDGAGLQDFIKQNFSQAKPVAVNVIDFGADADRATWEGVSQSTGGSYQNLNSSAGPELGAALATVLG
jgi:hypothetical protein